MPGQIQMLAASEGLIQPHLQMGQASWERSEAISARPSFPRKAIVRVVTSCMQP